MTERRALRARERARGELSAMLRAFHASTGCHATLWSWPADGAAASTGGGSQPVPTALPPGAIDGAGGDGAAAGGRRELATADGPVLLAALPGVSRTWLAVGPGDGSGGRPLATHADFLVPAVARYLQATAEVDQAAHELSERYEEINLLYTISESVGRAVSLEDTARRILAEVSDTVGARRAAVLLHDRVTDTLHALVALGTDADALPPIAAADPDSLIARAFGTLHPTIAEPDEPGAAAEAACRVGPMLVVPIVWTGQQGGEPLGVVTLSDRRFGQPFTAGDLKLVTAIASQIAAVIQNARLVRASLQQQRFAQEMALAHDLQMKLLPRPAAAAPHAHIAARVIPAESVGGDFYHLFDLGEGRTGVMIGDVSSHGYRAALIMALAMSATAIHAQGSSDPAATLAAVLRSLREELTSTEMFISTFYAVVDPWRGELHYANAGHPHAFVLGEDGTLERLPAGAPPLGMVDLAPPAAVRPWAAEHDLLLLFTDGVSDARDHDGARLGEAPVLDAAAAARAGGPDAVAARIFDALDAHTGDAPLRDDVTVVVVRS